MYSPWLGQWGVLNVLLFALLFLSIAISPTPAKAQTVTCSGGFIVHFEDVAQNTGIGFDDATLGQTRQDTVCAVFDYLATSVIVLSGATPDVLVAVSENDGTGPLATGAAFYPNSSSPGFIGGTLLDHITTGIDPTPGTNNYDARIQVDFGNRIIGSSTVTINSDHTVSSNGQLDLFSIILHEIIHAFGVASFMDANGASSVGVAYSLFDQYLQDGSGTPLIPTSGGTSSIITNGLVEYVEPGNSQSLAIYSPFFFQSGSSLSHLDDLRDLYPYLMRHSTSGGDDRVLSMAEIDILCDLGYTLYGTVCTNRYPLGVDDDNLVINTTTPGVQICIDVLNNDTDPDGDPIAIDPASVQILSGGGSFTINGNQICYTPSANFVGTAVIIYQPTDGLRTGNTTRVLFDVQGTFCPGDPTNYVCNGGFETPDPAPPLNFNTMYCGSSVVDNWCSATPSPDYFIRGGISTNSQSFDIPTNFFSTPAPNGEVQTWDFPNPNNNRYVGMRRDGLNNNVEGLQTELIQTLILNQLYVADFYAFVSGSGNLDGEIDVFLDTAPAPTNGQPSGNAQILGTFTANDDQWTHIQIPAFYPSNGQLEHLIIQVATPQPSTFMYIYVDDVSIREVNDINLIMQKTVDDLTPQLGQTINYTIQLCNQDAALVSSATIEETMPAGLTYVSGMNNYPQHTFSNILGNSCQSVTITATVDNTAPVNTPLTNCVGLTSAGTGNQSFAPDIKCVDITIPATDIMITKTINNPNPNPGDTVTFTIIIANLGPADASDIVINDLLPQGLNYSSHTISGAPATYDQLTGNLNIPLLSSSTLLTLDMVVVVDTNACGDLENIAFLASIQETDLNTINNHSTVTINLPACQGATGIDLSITKTPIMDCYAGGVCAFEVTITNNGTDPFSGPIQLADDWGPGNVTFQSASAPWDCLYTPQDSDMICDNPSVNLAPGGGSTSFIIVLEIPENPDSQILTNCVHIQWPQTGGMNGDSNPENDSFCTEAHIIYCAPKS